MRLKISYAEEPKHSDFVGCVGWNATDEVYSCGDDHVILKWNLLTKETTKVTELPAELYATDFHWFPRGYLARKKQGSDLLLITSADGKFHLLNKNGRFEKTVDAHKGAVLTGRWSYDGAGLLTAGEDGQIKIWSRSGMLRSTIVQIDTPVYSAAWGRDSNHILYTHGKTLVIRNLAPISAPNRWKAHDGLIFKVSWNPINNLIISGGEDCRYRVWDIYGRLLFSSLSQDYPIRAVSWSPNGDLFVVGSYNTLRLCDKSGWSYSLEKPNCGSICNIAWSSDGTQVAGACSSGHVVFGHIIERRLEWKDVEVSVTARKSITVHEVLHNTWEKLEFPDCIINMALGYRHLVIVTLSQCYIYLIRNWNTPVIFDFWEGSVSMLILSERYFLLAEKSGLSLYSYEGHLIGSPKWQNMELEILNPAHVTISPETIAVRDQVDEKLVHLFELGTARALVELPALKHNEGVLEVLLNQAGTPAERQIALVDNNRDLFLRNIRGPISMKLASMVQSLCWNSEVNMLAAVQDTNLIVWYYPNVVFADKRLTKKTTILKDASEFGKSPILLSFDGSHLSIRRIDGSLVNTSVSMYPLILHELVSSRWNPALNFCRHVKDDTLWACLAAMASHAKDLSTAEEAYAEIDELDKVVYIKHIKTIPIHAAQVAEMALLGGNVQDAESTLLQNGLVFRAIMSNINMHNWNRALELAVKYKTHVDTVMLYRRKYLQSLGKPETNEKFIQFENEVELDPDKITQKIETEYQRERESI